MNKKIRIEMNDENRLVTVLMIITVLLVIMLYACTYREPVDAVTRDAVEICGCNRPCVQNMCSMKNSYISESEYKKHCK